MDRVNLARGPRMGLLQGGRADYQRRLLTTQPYYLNAVWMLDEASGRVAGNSAPNRAASVDLIYNGGFETAGAGGADVFDHWTENAGDGTLAAEAALVHGGTKAAKLTTGPAANTWIRPYDNADFLGALYPRVTPGMSLTFSFWTRGDGANAGRYAVKDATHNTYIIALKPTGVAGAAYTQVSESFVVPAGCYALNISLWCPAATGGACYFDDVALTGMMGLDGVYTPAGVTYGTPGPIRGRAAVSVDGSDSGVLVGSRAYNAYFNANKGSAICWGKVDGAARWSDATTHRYLYHIKATPSLIHYICMGKNKDVNNRLFWIRSAGGTMYAANYDFPAGGTLDWFCMGMTWDVLSTPRRIACYLYTNEDRTWRKISDEAPVAGSEFWDQAIYPADGNYADLLAGTGLTTQEWVGSGGPAAEWGGVCLTEAEMQRVMAP